MIITNQHHETAIVIQHDGQTVTFVRLRIGKLGCERMTEATFREAWSESYLPLPDTIERFLEHGRTNGATQETIRGLTRLQERDQRVVASLF
jgi:hypothetical protein